MRASYLHKDQTGESLQEYSKDLLVPEPVFMTVIILEQF